MIADRRNAVVVSNDSFREFHEDYPWLLHRERLLGAVYHPSVGWEFPWRILDPELRNKAAPRAHLLMGSKGKIPSREPIPPSATDGGAATYLTRVTDIEHLWTADSRVGLYTKSDLAVVSECVGRDRRYWTSFPGMGFLYCSTMDGKYLWRTVWVDGLYGEFDDDTVVVGLQDNGDDSRVAGLANKGGWRLWIDHSYSEQRVTCGHGLVVCWDEAGCRIYSSVAGDLLFDSGPLATLDPNDPSWGAMIASPNMLLTHYPGSASGKVSAWRLV